MIHFLKMFSVNAVILLSFFMVNDLSAQATKVDKLTKELSAATRDTSRIRIMRGLAAAYSSVDPVKKFTMAKRYKQLAEKLEMDSVVAQAYIDMGVSCGMRSKLDSSFYYFSKGYDKSVASNYNMGKARALACIGFAYSQLDDKNEAVRNFKEALAIYKNTKYYKGITQCYVNIGSIYFDLGQNDLAHTYFIAAYEINKKNKNEIGMGSSMFSLGNVSRVSGNLKKAEYYYGESLKLRQAIGDLNGIALSSWGMGQVYTLKGEFDKALPYLQKALDLDIQLGQEYNKSAVLMSMANFYIAKKDYRKAEDYTLEALATGKKIKSMQVQSESYELLTEIAKKMQDIPKAYNYQSAFIAAKDSLESEKVLTNITLQELKRTRKENEDLVNDNELISLKNSNYQKTFVITSILLLLLVLLLIMYYRRNREKLAVNALLNEQKDEIAHINEELETINTSLNEQMEITDRQNMELEKLNAIKNKFFSIVAHDMRSPLASLKLLFELYREGQVGQSDLNDLLLKLENTVSTTSEFLDNLLEWSKNQMSGLVVNRVVVDLATLVNTNIYLLEAKISLKKLKVKSLEQQHIMVFADANMIDVVIRNLLSNSVKFCKDGDEIVFSAVDEGNHVVLCIKDSGPGISVADQQKLFNLEHTASTVGTGEKGYHIGLILCQDMILENNGKIWMESTLGEGTSFFVMLPKSA